MLPPSETSWLIDLLSGPISGTRERRKYIEAEWLLNYRAWQGWPSQSYTVPLPDGAIHYFIPHARRAVERNIARITKLLMPSSDWFETLPTDFRSHDNAEAVQAVLDYIYRKKHVYKRVVSSLSRCMQLYNFAVLHTSVRIENTDVWPLQRDKDPYSFYIFPDTSTSPEDALLIFEDEIIPYQVYRSFINEDSPEDSMYLPLSPDELHVPEWPYHLIERIAYRGLSSPSDFTQGTGSTKSLSERDISNAIGSARSTLSKQSRTFVSLTKCYFRVGSRWYFTVICNNTQGGPCVVRLDKEERTPLYRWANSRPLPAELYTNAPIDDHRVLQNLANTAISQVESNRSRFAEPPVLIDVSLLDRLEEYTFGNRKFWKVNGDPNQMLKSLDVEDTSTNGIRAFQIYLGLLDKGSGGTIAEGQPGRNMPRAGFVANNLLNLALADTEDIADTQEQELLTPGIGDMYHTLIEYAPASQIIKIPGKAREAIKSFTCEELYGDYSFTWLGSLGFQDSMQRADKFMRFLEILTQPISLQILLPAMERQGYSIDFAALFETVYGYGIGERGIRSIIRKVPVPPQTPPSQEQAPSSVDQAQAQEDLRGKELDNEGKELDTQLAYMDHLTSLMGRGQNGTNQNEEGPRYRGR